MPKFFKTKAEQLHAEAFATLMLLEDRYFNSMSPQEADRRVKLVIKARNRVYRRWELAYKYGS